MKHRVDACEIVTVAKFFPMRRELKDYSSRTCAAIALIRRRKVFPYEEGTESLTRSR